MKVPPSHCRVPGNPGRAGWRRPGTGGTTPGLRADTLHAPPAFLGPLPATPRSPRASASTGDLGASQEETEAQRRQSAMAAGQSRVRLCGQEAAEEQLGKEKSAHVILQLSRGGAWGGGRPERGEGSGGDETEGGRGPRAPQLEASPSGEGRGSWGSLHHALCRGWGPASSHAAAMGSPAPTPVQASPLPRCPLPRPLSREARSPAPSARAGAAAWWNKKGLVGWGEEQEACGAGQKHPAL